MIFLAIVASLTAVMAIVSEGNVRSAESAVRVSRSLSAAESGLRMAHWRLRQEAARFIVEAGDLDDGFGTRLWRGTWSSADGPVTVLDPDGYTSGGSSGPGLMHAVYDAHIWHDDHEPILVDGQELEPDLDSNLGTVASQGIPVPSASAATWFQVRYEMLADGSGVRVTSRGVDGDVERVVQMDFALDKKIEYALLGQSRIMIGKNVVVDGPVGALYGTVEGELDPDHGDPLVIDSDFSGLDEATLDPLLDLLHVLVEAGDVDGDGRLRPSHPVEGSALSSSPELIDHDEDQYIDDFDLFLGVFDANDDKMVVFDPAAAQNAGWGSLGLEFDGDPDLAAMLDQSNPDRNQDGAVDGLDLAMGLGDGILDRRDCYAKIRGHVNFAVESSPWELARDASWQSRVRGVIRPRLGDSPVSFAVDETTMTSLTSEMFLNSTTWYEAQANAGTEFWDAVAANGGWGGETTDPEPVPLGSAGAYDVFDRPVFRDMYFMNVRVPMGLNALFINCWFLGVTWVETTEDCTDVNWNYAGARELLAGGETQLRFPDLTAVSGGTEYSDTSLVSNNIRFDDCTILGTLSGDRPLGYTHWRNKIQLTGGTRFFIDPMDEAVLAEPDASAIQAFLYFIPESDREELARTSMLLPGWSVDVGNFDSDTSSTVQLNGTIVTGLIDIRGSAAVNGTLMTTFRPAEGEGPLYYGGTPDAFNTTLGYFSMDDGDGEGVDVEDPAFNGYGRITITYDPDAKLPDGIPWPLLASPLSPTWYEGGSW